MPFEKPRTIVVSEVMEALMNIAHDLSGMELDAVIDTFNQVLPNVPAGCPRAVERVLEMRRIVEAARMFKDTAVIYCRHEHDRRAQDERACAVHAAERAANEVKP